MTRKLPGDMITAVIEASEVFSEAGESPALYLSNRDIYERTKNHWRQGFREGVQVGLMIQSVDLPACSQSAF